MPTTAIHVGDAAERLRQLPPDHFNCCVTSPPYWRQRDYDAPGQLGQEKTWKEYVEALNAIFDEVHRVLRPDGVLWLNLGDKMLKKQLVGIPWRVAFRMQRAGWLLRAENIWHKRNVIPESVKDRTSRCHEQVFQFTKSEDYFYDHVAVQEPYQSKPGTRGLSSPYQAASGRNDGSTAAKGGWRVPEEGGRNLRSVWTMTMRSFRGSHFATMPVTLATRCIKASCPPKGQVLDPFGGAGTTALAAMRLGHDAVLCELNAEYAAIAKRRLIADSALTNRVAIHRS